MWSLKIVTGAELADKLQPEVRLPQPLQRFTIGRDPVNSWPIADRTLAISGRHCEVIATPDGPALRDLSPTAPSSMAPPRGWRACTGCVTATAWSWAPLWSPSAAHRCRLGPQSLRALQPQRLLWPQRRVTPASMTPHRSAAATQPPWQPWPRGAKPRRARG